MVLKLGMAIVSITLAEEAHHLTDFIEPEFSMKMES
jgi:hypothetical protein